MQLGHKKLGTVRAFGLIVRSRGIQAKVLFTCVRICYTGVRVYGVQRDWIQSGCGVQ